MLKSFSFSQHCSSSGCGAVLHLSLSRVPSPSPLRAPLFSCLQRHRFAVRKQHSLGVSVHTAQTQPPGTCPSHTPTPATGCSRPFRCRCPFLLLSNPLGRAGGTGHGPTQSPRETPGQGQLLLLLFPTSSDISKVSVVFSSCGLRESPPCCLNRSVGWFCRVSSPRTAVLGVFAELIENTAGQGVNHLPLVYQDEIQLLGLS